MQNKDLNEIDKILTNQAWGQMQDILDTEMPTKRRRRLLPFFWIFLFGVGLGFGLFAIWTAENEKITSTSTSTSNSTSNKTVPAASAAHGPSSKMNKAANPGDFRPAVAQVAAENKNESLNANEKIISTSNSTSNKTVPAASRLPAAQVVAHAPNSKTNKESKATLAQLNQLDLKALDIGRINPKLNPTKLDFSQEKATASLHQLGLEIGIGHDFSKQANCHIGGFWTYQVKPKWAIETGLKYHYFAKAKSLSINNNSADLLADTSLEPALGGGVNEEDTSTTVSNPTEMSGNATVLDNEKQNILEQYNRHALVLPIQIGYQWRPKWAVYGGMQVAYIFGIKTGNTAGANTFQSGNYAPNPKNSVELWTKAGLRYQMTKALAVDLGYNYSLYDNSSIQGATTIGRNPYPRNHFTKLAIRYNF